MSLKLDSEPNDWLTYSPLKAFVAVIEFGHAPR